MINTSYLSYKIKMKTEIIKEFSWFFRNIFFKIWEQVPILAKLLIIGITIFCMVKSITIPFIKSSDYKKKIHIMIFCVLSSGILLFFILLIILFLIYKLA